MEVVRIRNANVEDSAAIAGIYNQGIDDRIATYETERRSAKDQRAWLESIAGQYPAVVAQSGCEIIGWAGAAPYRDRECYRGSPSTPAYRNPICSRVSSHPIVHTTGALRLTCG